MIGRLSEKCIMKTKMRKRDAAERDIEVNELRETIWAVVTFDRCAARDLTYDEAVRKIAELQAKKVAGLCIVPNSVADRLPKR